MSWITSQSIWFWLYAPALVYMTLDSLTNGLKAASADYARLTEIEVWKKRQKRDGLPITSWNAPRYEPNLTFGYLVRLMALTFIPVVNLITATTLVILECVWLIDWVGGVWSKPLIKGPKDQ